MQCPFSQNDLYVQYDELKHNLNFSVKPSCVMLLGEKQNISKFTYQTIFWNSNCNKINKQLPSNKKLKVKWIKSFVINFKSTTLNIYINCMLIWSNKSIKNQMFIPSFDKIFKNIPPLNMYNDVNLFKNFQIVEVINHKLYISHSLHPYS